MSEKMASNAETQALYKSLLGRTPSAQELAYWSSTGKAASSIAADIKYSSEYTSKPAGGTTDYSGFDNIYTAKGQGMTTADYDYWNGYQQQYGDAQTKNAMAAAFDKDRLLSHNNAYKDAQKGAGDDYWSSLGITSELANQYGLDDQYKSYIDEIYNSLNKKDLLPAGAYNPAKFAPALQSGVNNAKQNWMTGLTNEFGQKYAPNYSQTLFGSEIDDDIISEILGMQKANAMSTITAARDRGQLNTVGFNKAVADLETQGGAASALVNALGEGIIGGYRSKANTLIDNARSGLGSLTPGAKYDFSSLDSALGQLRTQSYGGLKNELLAAMGDTQYFTPLKAIKSGGAGQGLINPITSGITPDLLGDDLLAQKRRQDKLTTAGNQVF